MSRFHVPTAVAFLLAALRLSAAEPTVRDVSVRGLQTNGTTALTVSGDDLGKAPKLLLPFGAKQQLKPGNTDKKCEFEVTLEGATPGLYQLRLLTEGGASLPTVIGVDSLAQRPFAPKVEALPAALHGALTGSTVLETTFDGKGGQKVVIEVEAQRIGSKLRPVVHLLNAKKLQLDWAWGKSSLGGDARLVATLPADGAYTVTLHDAEYAGPAPGFFRLKIGAFDFVEQVFPPVAGPDTKGVSLTGTLAARFDLPSRGGPFAPIDWPKGGTWTGPRPFIEFSARPELVRTSDPAPFALPPGRVGVCGKLASAGAEDRFTVPVEPKAKVRFEVFAERLGSPLDAALVVRNEAGAVLARGEDSPGSLDPVLDYTVPEKVTSLVVGVIDAGGRGGPRGVYRLTVDPAKAEGPGDFRLSTPLQRLNLPAGGRAVVPMFVERRGFVGPITLTADGLTADGLKLDGAVIPPDADGALVTVSAAGEVPARVVTWVGKGGADARPVFVRSHPLEKVQPWLATEFSIATTSAKADDFQIAWKALPADIGLSPGGKLALPVSVTRADPAAPVRLTLLTSQNPPLANNQPDPNRAIRLEKPTEFGAKVAEGEVSALVPPELPADAYQVAVLAELLTPDKQRVLASAVTPVRRLPVKLPVAVKFDAPKLEAKLDPKANAALEVKGTVQRMHGFDGDVVVTLTGQPAGVPAVGPVTVKAGEMAFAFKLALPPETPPGEAKLKLGATAAPDPKQPNVRVKARDAEVLLGVLPPPK